MNVASTIVCATDVPPTRPGPYMAACVSSPRR
jgi:hypothetical protein